MSKSTRLNEALAPLTKQEARSLGACAYRAFASRNKIETPWSSLSRADKRWWDAFTNAIGEHHAYAQYCSIVRLGL